MIVQSATDWSIVRPIVPPKFRSGIGSIVRSGLNLPIASAKESSTPRRPPCRSTPPTSTATRQRLLNPEPLLAIEHRDDPGRPRRQVLPDLVVQLKLEAMIDKLADRPARHRSNRDRRQQRRREQSNSHADTPAPTRALRLR